MRDRSATAIVDCIHASRNGPATYMGIANAEVGRPAETMASSHEGFVSPGGRFGRIAARTWIPVFLARVRGRGSRVVPGSSQMSASRPAVASWA